MNPPGPGGAEAECLRRTRSAVMNVLVLDGLLIALSGVLLARRGPGLVLLPPATSDRWFFVALLLLVALGSFTRLVGMHPRVLADPDRRAARFLRAHLAGALAGTLALPLGFAYGWTMRPRLMAVGPFWAVAMVMGLLALPLAEELAGFDRPMRPGSDRDAGRGGTRSPGDPRGSGGPS